MIYSQIILPTWISGNSKTIIGSMFSNIAELLIKSISEFSPNNYTYKKNAEVYDWSRFNKNLFLNDFYVANWNSVMEIEKNDVKTSLNNSLSKVNSLIMSHVLMKKTK